MNQKKQTQLAVLSMTGFIALWAIVTDAWNYSAMLSQGQPVTVCRYLYGYFSRILWASPAFILIRRFDRNLFWSRRQLFSRPKVEPIFAVFMVLTTIYALVSMALDHHFWNVSGEDFLFLTIKVFLVGIVEETVFRGWGYNLLKNVRSNTVSLMISTSMFVVLHWPAYFIKLFLYGSFDRTGMISQSISALLCGLLFAVMLRRSGTLWNPVLAHFYYDWVLELFA